MKRNRIDCKRRQLAMLLSSALALGALRSAQGATPAAPRILVMGDSLSAEYGLARGAGWVALLQARLAQRHIPGEVVNASISGETTSGGRSRLAALLQRHRPTHVVIELGANDALRGLPLKSTRENLQTMVSASQKMGAQVVLVGMMVPPNYGRRYTEDFAKLFADLAAQNKTALVPFLLKGLADRPDARDWFQPDGLHPLAKGHPVMLDQVWTALGPLLLGRQAGA